MVEGSRYTVNFHNEQPIGSQESNFNEIGERCVDRNQKESGTQSGSKAEKIITFLQQFPVSPIQHIFSLNIWLTSKYKFFNRVSPLMLNILKIHGAFYNDMSIEELYTHFCKCDPQNLIFNAPQTSTENYYYNIEESVGILERLIQYQFNHNIHHIQYFYECIFNVADKKIPKKNTIFILSPPNAGKNFFFDAFIHYCINVGQMGNFNRYCTFPLMECVDKRIIIWNEPMMEPSAQETLKCILGGDTCNAKVKYQGDAVICRTPVIILSNNDIFPKNEAFRSRIYQFNWKPAPFLKEYTLKPHPIAIYHLYNRYIKNKLINH